MKHKNLLKKLVLAIVVALGVAAAGYFGLDITEEEITNTFAPIVEDVFTEEPVVEEEVTEEPVVEEEVTQ